MPSPYGTFVVNLPTPAPGGSATYRLAFSRPTNGAAGDFSVHLLGMTTKNVGLGESNPYNNGSPLTVRTTDGNSGPPALSSSGTGLLCLPGTASGGAR